MPEKTIHHVDETRNGGLLEVACADDIDVRLAENATTGFRWRLKSTGAPVLALEDDRTSAGSQKLPGAGGVRLFRFRAASAGTARVELAYARGFPANAAPAKTFVLQVSVLP